MIRLLRLLLVIFVIFCSIRDTHAESELLDKTDIDLALKAHDTEKLCKIGELIEDDWHKKNYTTYFEKMIALCERILTSKDISTPEYVVFQNIASQILQKPCAMIKPSYLARKKQLLVVTNLLIGRPNFMDQKLENSFTSFRSRNVRLMVLLIARMRADLTPNFKPHTVYANMNPPINPDNEFLMAGMRPSDIKNPAARAAYEKVLEENGRNIAENGEQQHLQQTLQSTLSTLESHLKFVYTQKPPDYYELSEYMMLGGLDAETRQRILDAIAVNTGVQPPVGLLPTTEEIESNKLEKAAEKIESQKNATSKIENEKKP